MKVYNTIQNRGTVKNFPNQKLENKKGEQLEHMNEVCGLTDGTEIVNFIIPFLKQAEHLQEGGLAKSLKLCKKNCGKHENHNYSTLCT